MRTAEIKRKTKETDIKLTLDVDGKGAGEINTGCGFLDHMLTLFAKHGGFDLTVYCKGDINVDYHHTTEDIGIALGQALKTALGDKRGIRRYGSIILPMDEALVMTAVDISGRPYLGYMIPIPTQKVGDFDTELVEEFFAAFVRESGVTLHIRLITGGNSHHIIEAAFKSVGRSLREAVKVNEDDPDAIPSTKGVL